MGASYFPAQNKDIVTIKRGQWVAIHNSGSGVVLANASSTSKPAVGVMSADTVVGATQNVVADEVFTLTDWSEVAGTTNLQGGKVYFLSNLVNGRMTLSPTTIMGQIAQPVGRAISPIILEIEIGQAVLL